MLEIVTLLEGLDLILGVEHVFKKQMPPKTVKGNANRKMDKLTVNGCGKVFFCSEQHLILSYGLNHMYSDLPYLLFFFLNPLGMDLSDGNASRNILRNWDLRLESYSIEEGIGTLSPNMGGD